ncbi:DUF4286 family protein [Myroides pelagicus]|uniref:DUF4286 family protein n=1 Tax=Myroides pelagicus TaxID=270914 RepID=A0A7K1GKM2_9FLAO|nr:DUF4286 family protein [Myroides pelagicus]MEC4113199.1 DUF4286 family protein [Myroides pelagicus]MTH29366.1 DUF4286 family protein [Myroides pelagicus]
MIIYNITINIHDTAHDTWMQWMENAYIPGILATGKFDKARMVKVLIEEEMGGQTYSVQFETKDKAHLEQFYKEDFDKFENEAKKLFGEMMLTFKTELALIKEY